MQLPLYRNELFALVTCSAVFLERLARQLRLDMPLGGLRQLFDELGQTTRPGLDNLEGLLLVADHDHAAASAATGDQHGLRIGGLSI
jgi:hypothetical protein